MYFPSTYRAVALAAAFIVCASASTAQVRVAPNPDMQQFMQSEIDNAGLFKAQAAADRAALAVLGDRASSLDTDEMQAAIADLVPGFAGFEYRADGKTIARMTQASGLVSRAGVTSWRGMGTPAARFAESLGEQADVAPAIFDARELLRNKELAFRLPGDNAVVSTWIDRSTNRTHVGYDETLDAEGLANLREQLKAAGVNLDAVVLQPEKLREAVQQVGTSIRAQVQPVAGGSEFNFNTTRGGFLCSVGVPAIRNGVWGFVTASHCSERVYNRNTSTNTFTPNGAFLGTENIDPAGTTNCNGLTSVDLGCRRADALFVSVGSAARSVVLGRIAFTNTNAASAAPTAASLQVRGSLGVLGSAARAPVGATVFKTGRTTGTTSGRVTRDCVATRVSTGSGATFYGIYGALCSTETTDMVRGGDSGSALWVFESNQARIVGITSYGNGSTLAGFSRWGSVTGELGALTIR